MVGSWFAQVVFDWIKAVKKSHWRRGEGRTTPPAAHGEDMLVPFMSCLRCPHHCGTGAIAPPMLQMFTPMSPSAAGPTNNPKPFNFLSNGFGCLCNRTAIRSGISLHRGLRSTMRSRHFNSGGNYVHGVNACMHACVPRELQLYCCPAHPSGSELRGCECTASAELGDTKAPTPMMHEDVPPGAPTVVRAGPLLPALDRKITPLSCTISCMHACSRLHLHAVPNWVQQQVPVCGTEQFSAQQTSMSCDWSHLPEHFLQPPDHQLPRVTQNVCTLQAQQRVPRGSCNVHRAPNRHHRHLPERLIHLASRNQATCEEANTPPPNNTGNKMTWHAAEDIGRSRLRGR